MNNIYEHKSETELAFVPKRLEVPGRPELSNFPFNILFGAIRSLSDDNSAIETAEYLPDIESFKQDGVEQKMKYYNKHDNRRYYWAEIIYDTSNKGYVGFKYRGKKSVGGASGSHWGGFFAHFTILGIAENS